LSQITYRMVSKPAVWYFPYLNLRCDNVISAVDLRARSTVHVVSLGHSRISHKATSDTLCWPAPMRYPDLIWAINLVDPTAPMKRHFNLSFTWVSAIL